MRIKVWDLPTRLFHWSLVLTVAVTFIPAGDDPWLRLHVTTGHLVLGLIAFRLVWGVIGNRHARFATFVRPWSDVRQYLATLFGPGRVRFVGHNPAAGWMILGLLGMLLMICLTGIGVYGGEEGRGLLRGVVSYAWGLRLKDVHLLASYLLLLMIGLHVVGVFAESRLHRENLLKAMWTGQKEADATQYSTTEPSEPPTSRLTSALVGLYFTTGLVAAIASYLYRPPPPQNPYVHVAWQSECSACHMAFPPLLLPASSWRQILGDLENHFGDDASLDSATAEDILAFLISHAAETSETEAARRILASLGPGERPLRITDTPYWVEKHQRLDEAIYRRESVRGRSNCVACHRWADRGSFEDDDISIPRS